MTGARAGAFPELGHPELLAISGESHVEAALGGWGVGVGVGRKTVCTCTRTLANYYCRLLPLGCSRMSVPENPASGARPGTQ